MSMIPDASRAKLLNAIDDLWPKMLHSCDEDNGTLVGLPHPYIVPAVDVKAEFRFAEQYYWDSYFIALGLVQDPHNYKIAEGMLDNLLYMYGRFQLIPNASRSYMTSRSQPPILSTYIFLLYDNGKKDLDWLKKRMSVAMSEYEHVWMGESHPIWHRVHRGLSRYYDINVLHDLAEAESGWDMTPRFERKCLDYLPVDLNSLLYKYEIDFARYERIIGNTAKSDEWVMRAEERKSAMNQLMWAKVRGFYFDYNYQTSSQGDTWSLAAYYPMWAGLATADQAKRLVNNLRKFEKAGGLTTTLKPLVDLRVLFGSLKTQWAYPNGWAPLHYIVIEGLKNYGYHKDAERIMTKWLHTVAQTLESRGVFLEKYNVVQPHKMPTNGVYPTQIGFGWTNGVTAYFLSQKS